MVTSPAATLTWISAGWKEQPREGTTLPPAWTPQASGFASAVPWHGAEVSQVHGNKPAPPHSGASVLQICPESTAGRKVVPCLQDRSRLPPPTTTPPSLPVLEMALN